MTTTPLANPKPPSAGRVISVLSILFLTLLLAAHSLLILTGMGGPQGLRGPWPIFRHDHPTYFHSAWVTRSFLSRSATTAGYDPYFMAGYPKSVVFPASSTLPEIVVFLFGARDPVLIYKLYVLVSAAGAPLLFAAAAHMWARRPVATAIATPLALLYIWTDFPINYAAFGMLPYFVGIPLALLAVILTADYLEHGGCRRWLLAALACSAAFFTHLTTAMVIAPALLSAYAAFIIQTYENPSESTEPRPSARLRHVGFWLIPLVVLALNAFWWTPGIPLASTKGPSDFAFNHSEEGVLARLLKIIDREAQIEPILFVLGPIGAAILARRKPIPGAALIGFGLAGFFWGYLAGGFPSLDFLQPGRHTYAFYLAACIGASIALSDAFAFVFARTKAAAFAAATILIAAAGYGIGPDLLDAIRFRTDPRDPFLSSRAPARLRWVVDRTKKVLHPGERLLYEEAGKDIPGERDPFGGGRYSGLLPYYTGVEVLGGPYLHAALTTNHTQFGEGKLFGRADWDRDWFVENARLYRPKAMIAWSRKARSFMIENPDLIEIIEDEGALLLGRVRGFAGKAIHGRADVTAAAGHLNIRSATADVDGRAVLSYHFVPHLRGAGPGPAHPEPVTLGADPVPFIGLRPDRDGPDATLELRPLP